MANRIAIPALILVFSHLLLIYTILTNSQKVVTPVKTGIQGFYNYLNLLDSYFRGNDENGFSATSCKTINLWKLTKRDES